MRLREIKAGTANLGGGDFNYIRSKGFGGGAPGKVLPSSPRFLGDGKVFLMHPVLYCIFI